MKAIEGLLVPRFHHHILLHGPQRQAANHREAAEASPEQPFLSEQLRGRIGRGRLGATSNEKLMKINENP